MERGKKRQISEMEADIEPTPKKSRDTLEYKKFFTFKGAGRNKVGFRTQCRDLQEIKMTLSNTSGLKRHLLRQHAHIYQSCFPDSDVPKGLFQNIGLDNFIVSFQELVFLYTFEILHF